MTFDFPKLFRVMAILLVVISAWVLQPTTLDLDSNPATFILFIVASAILLYRKYRTDSIINSGIQHIFIQLLLIAGGLVLLISRFMPDFQVIFFIFGMGLVLSGLTLTMTGFHHAKLFLFPLLVLFCLIPLLSVADALLSFPMRRLSAILASYALYPWFDGLIVSGTELTAEGITISVTAACDGLTLFQNMIWIGWLYLLGHPSARRFPLSGVMTFFAAVLLANSLRVSALFIASHWWGISILTSEWHDIIGWSAVALAVMIFILMDKSIREDPDIDFNENNDFKKIADNST